MDYNSLIIYTDGLYDAYTDCKNPNLGNIMDMIANMLNRKTKDQELIKKVFDQINESEYIYDIETKQAVEFDFWQGSEYDSDEESESDTDDGLDEKDKNNSVLD